MSYLTKLTRGRHLGWYITIVTFFDCIRVIGYEKFIYVFLNLKNYCAVSTKKESGQKNQIYNYPPNFYFIQ